MKRRRPLKPVWSRYWPIVLALSALVVLYLLAPVLAPFVTAAVLAYILEPLVVRLVALRWPRTLAVSAVLAGAALILVALVLGVVPLFIRQLAAVLDYGPELLTWLRDTARPWLVMHTGMDIDFDVEQVKTWLTDHGSEAGQALGAVLPTLKTGGLALLGFIANLVLVPVVLFYFLRDWDALLASLDELPPRRWHARLHEVIEEVDDVLGQFLRGQLSVILLMALFYSVGLWLCGLKSSLAIGVVAGLLVFVPYLGVIVGVALATLAALLQFQSLAGLLPVWAVFLLGQLIEGFVVTPKLVGERIGLHPVAVIFALMAFGQLFGFVGVLLALPLAAMLLVGLRRLRRHYLDSHLYKR